MTVPQKQRVLGWTDTQKTYLRSWGLALVLFLDFSVGARVRSHPSLCAQTLRHVGSGTHGVCKEAAYEFEIQEL